MGIAPKKTSQVGEIWVWRKIEQEGQTAGNLVPVSTYQGKPFWDPGVVEPQPYDNSPRFGWSCPGHGDHDIGGALRVPGVTVFAGDVKERQSHCKKISKHVSCNLIASWLDPWSF